MAVYFSMIWSLSSTCRRPLGRWRGEMRSGVYVEEAIGSWTRRGIRGSRDAVAGREREAGQLRGQEAANDQPRAAVVPTLHE